MTQNLGERSVIVTGGGSGIGRAAVKLLGEAGAFITVADRDEKGGNDAVAEIRAAGKGKAQFVRTDIADEASVKAMVAAAEASYGKLDSAINAAAISQYQLPLTEISTEQWDRVNGVNLRGMFFCLKHQILAMQKRSAGSIVAIASASAILGIPKSAEYCASKAGVTGLVRGAAVDYAAQGIRINAILPGVTRTPMLEAVINKDPAVQGMADMLPMKRFAQPHEIAAAAVWLVSDSASYVTGASWLVDGALTIV
jgi:NAD(P)-dependent dehydrogenase (short-subunit alcohol dehydrogenase family)